LHGRVRSHVRDEGSEGTRLDRQKNRATSDTIYFLNEAGGVRHLANKVELYSKIDAFLAQNLGVLPLLLEHRDASGKAAFLPA